jgi:hypothetical protein
MNNAAIERNRCPLTDEELDRLGTHFTYFKYDELGITFENFVARVRNDTWKLMF